MKTGFSSLTLTISSPKEQKSKEKKKGKSPLSVPILCDYLFKLKLLVFRREEEEETKAEELLKLGRKYQNSASCARLGPACWRLWESPLGKKDMGGCQHPATKGLRRKAPLNEWCSKWAGKRGKWALSMKS